MKNKILLSIILCLLIVFTLSSLSVSATTIVDSGTCGDNISWTLNSSGTLKIEGVGDIKSCGWKGYPWQSYIEQIFNIEICDGITNIPGYAFLYASNVENVEIPSSVTYVGVESFHGCSKITDLTLPYGVKKIHDEAFQDCVSLENVYIPSSVYSIESWAFDNCKNIKNVYIDDMGAWVETFFRYSSSNPLYYAENLYLNNQLVEDVVIPIGTSEISSNSFVGYDKLKSIVVPNTVTKIGKAFSGCTSLTKIEIPESVSQISSGIFSGCIGLTEIIVNDNNTHYTSLNGVLFNKELTTIYYYPPAKLEQEYTIPAGVTLIADSAFYNATNLVNIHIPNTVLNIEQYAFANCNRLLTIDIPDGVQTIGTRAFYDCSLTTLKLPSSVTNVNSQAFFGCGIESLYISDISAWCHLNFHDYNTSPLHPSTKLYLNNQLVKDLVIPEGTKYIGDYSFYNYDGFDSITIPGSVETIGHYSFYRCKNLENVFINEGVKSIGIWAFASSGLKTITLPDTITRIANFAFSSTSIDTLYFEGAPSKWEALNVSLTNANIQFRKYLVTILNDDNSIFLQNSYYKNTQILKEDILKDNGYVDYILYKDKNKSIRFDASTLIKNDIELYIDLIPGVFVHKFINEQNIVLEKSVEYKTVITPPENPSKAATKQYTYKFSGWDGYEDGITQKSEEMIFTAKYDAVINQYTYKFVDDNGEVLKEKTVDYGSMIEIPDNPTKESTQQHTYTFAGWDGYTSGMTLEDDIEFTATYTATVNQYTYKFIDDNGDVLKEETVDYGTAIVAPENPDDKDAYTFDYWEGFSDGMTVVGDITFKAVYKYKIYNVSVFGYEDLKTDVIYNRNYTITPAEKYGYEFLGYYSEENGHGTKLTDEAGNSLAVYNTEDNSVVYPYFKDLLCNKVVVSGTDTLTIGDTGVRYTVSLGTDRADIYYTTIKVKYPKVFILEEVVNKKFDETEIIEITEHEDYNIAEILCVYSYEGNAIPTLTPIDAFEMCFNVDKTSKVQDVTVDITNDSVLMGEADDYQFDGFVNAGVSIQPKLAESVAIEGLSQIDASAQYKAIVYPDYTTDKTVVWSVSDETIATISDKGVLTPIKNGTVTITATANDGSKVFAIKTVDVIAYAQISSISTNGTWSEEFKNGKRNYTIYVGEDVTTFDISARYSKGTFRVNGSTLLSGRSKTVELTGDETIITVERLNVDEMTDITYTLTVIKSSAALISEVKTSENGYEFNIILNKDNVETFETAKLVVALYDGSGKFMGFSPVDVNGSDTKKVVPIETETTAYAAKVMLWNGLDTLKPLCNATVITLK